MVLSDVGLNFNDNTYSQYTGYTVENSHPLLSSLRRAGRGSLGDRVKESGTWSTFCI